MSNEQEKYIKELEEAIQIMFRIKRYTARILRKGGVNRMAERSGKRNVDIVVSREGIRFHLTGEIYLNGSDDSWLDISASDLEETVNINDLNEILSILPSDDVREKVEMGMGIQGSRETINTVVHDVIASIIDSDYLIKAVKEDLEISKSCDNNNGMAL